MYYFGFIFLISVLFIALSDNCISVLFHLPVSEEQDKYFQNKHVLS